MKPKYSMGMKIFTLALFGMSIISLTGCVPVDHRDSQASRPSLREVRLGNAQGPVAEDMDSQLAKFRENWPKSIHRARNSRRLWGTGAGKFYAMM